MYELTDEFSSVVYSVSTNQPVNLANTDNHPFLLVSDIFK